MNRIRIIQDGRVISNCVYRFVSLGRYTGKVGSVECFASVTSIKHKRLSPADMACRPFTIQVFTPEGELVSTFGIATRDQVAAHPQCTETAPA